MSTYICIFVCTYVYIHTYTLTHTHIYTFIFKYIHAYVLTLEFLSFEYLRSQAYVLVHHSII